LPIKILSGTRPSHIHSDLDPVFPKEIANDAQSSKLEVDWLSKPS
jgi:hypothetical protein